MTHDLTPRARDHRRTLAAVAFWAALGAAFATEAAPAPAAATRTASLSDAAYAKKADALVKRFADAGLFSGAVVVAVDGKPIFRRAFGLANREWDAPAGLDTVFRLGSMTKAFTAAAILRLSEQGKIRLDDPLTNYYPEVPEAWRGVTVRQLLTNTSGIPDFTKEEGLLGLVHNPDASTADAVALVRASPLAFAPGGGFENSSTNYVLLGAVIEKVSGRSYADHLQTDFFAPLGMRASGFDRSASVLRHRAAGYELADGEVENTVPVSMAFAGGGGALYSSADDLLIWDEALRAGKVISPTAVETLMTDQGHGWGMGYEVETRNGRRFVSQAGRAPGFMTVLFRYPEQKMTIIAFANLGPAVKVANDLADLYFGDLTERATVAVDPRSLARYVGVYRDSAGTTVTVSRRDNRLFARLSGTPIPPLELSAASERAFFSKIADLQVTFVDGGAGSPPEVVVQRGGKTLRAQRSAMQ